MKKYSYHRPPYEVAQTVNDGVKELNLNTSGGHVCSAQPNLPIVCVSRPNYTHGEDAQKRREVIMKTVNNAMTLEDKNVYFVDGGKFCDGFGAGDSISVVSVHPNGLDFICMANQ